MVFGKASTYKAFPLEPIDDEGAKQRVRDFLITEYIVYFKGRGLIRELKPNYVKDVLKAAFLHNHNEEAMMMSEQAGTHSQRVLALMEKKRLDEESLAQQKREEEALAHKKKEEELLKYVP